MLVESSIVRSTPVDSDDIVSMINDEYDSWVDELNVKLKKLRLLVRFSDYQGKDELLELIDDIRNIEIKL